MQHLNEAYQKKHIVRAKKWGGQNSLSPGGEKLGGDMSPGPPSNYAHDRSYFQHI